VRRFPFDEALQTLLEFEDFCLEVARAGERIVFEPAAVVAQLLPPVVPRSFTETAFFLQRWHPRKNLVSIVHFRQKWSLTSDDPALRDVLHWTNARRRGLLRLPALRPVRRALRAFIGGGKPILLAPTLAQTPEESAA
jgi:hypothetical protein